MHEATTRYADALDLDSPILSYNGAMVKRPRTGEVWHHLPAPAEPAAEVIRYCARHRHHLNFYLNDHLHVAERGRWAEFYLAQTGSPMEVSGDLTQFCGQEPTKMILIDAPEVTDRLLEEFKESLGDSLYITKTNPEYLEFMNPQTNKGAALKLVADRLGIRREETLAFGDGNNDIPMLRWAGMGIAMDAANRRVQAAANRIAPSSPDEGLGIIIEELLRI